MNIIYFDGYCGLCNGFVDLMLRIDKDGVFKFSPLQGAHAAQNLSRADIEDLKSIVVVIDEKTYRQSEAVLRAMAQLGGIWKALLLLNQLPKSITNAGYNLVAENRYKLFGKKESCRLPTPDERARFLD